MPKQPPERLHTAKSLTRAQYDAMYMRAALLARQLPTISLPGQVVFTSDHPGPPLAFTQLSSYGDTYGAMGLVKTSRRTWQVLSRSGVPVPQSQTFFPDAQAQAAAYAARIGFPAVICSRAGIYRRSAHDAASFKKSFEEVAARVEDRVLVHSTLPGELLRFMVQGQQVLAVTAQGRKETQSRRETQGRRDAHGRRVILDPDDIDPTLLKLAVAAVEAIPGLDVAAVSISSADRQAVVERVTRSPHLRDFAAGSSREALRLADRLVQTAAQDLSIPLAEPSARTSADLVFTGVPDPESFAIELDTMVNSLSRVTALREPQRVPDGAELSIHGRPSDVALIITRAIAGFATDDSAHLVRCCPTASD